MIEQGIQQLIVAETRFTSLAGTRLYPVLLPEDSPLPAATFQVIAVKTLYALDSRVNVTQMRLQIDTWGGSYADVKSLSSAVIEILDGFTGVLPDTTHVFGIQLRNATDDYEHEALTYRVMLEFAIQFAQSS